VTNNLRLELDACDFDQVESVLADLKATSRRRASH
jgi:hypothetical protein